LGKKTGLLANLASISGLAFVLFGVGQVPSLEAVTISLPGAAKDNQLSDVDLGNIYVPLLGFNPALNNVITCDNVQNNVNNKILEDIYLTNIDAEAPENIIYASTPIIYEYIYSGLTKTDDSVVDNTANVQEGDIFGERIHGAHARGLGDSINSKANTSGGKMDEGTGAGDGWAASGNVRGNGVDIIGGEVNGWVFGGTSDTGDAVGNRVTTSGGTADTATTATDITGVTRRGGDSGPEATNARGNSAAITGNAPVGARNVHGGQVNGSGTGSGSSFLVDTAGTVKDAGWIAVGFVDFDGGRLEGNRAEVASGTFGLAAADIGGASRGPESGSLPTNTGNASGNSVAMAGSVPVVNVRGMFGGQANGAGSGPVSSALFGTAGSMSEDGSIAGGLVYFPDGELKGNKVEVYDGVTKEATGIYGAAGSQFQAAGLAVNASGNSASVYGGDVSGNSICGPWTDLWTATSGSVALSGATIIVDASLYGVFPRPGGDAFAGNALKVVDYGGTSTVGGIGNFENFDFRLSSSTGNGDTILSTASLELGGHGQASRVSSLGVAGGGAILRPGDTITLIRSGATTGLFENSTLSASKGVTILYDIAASLDGAGNMVATVVNSSAHPQSKALSEGYLSGQALLSQAADLATGKGISQAAANALDSGPRAFGAFGGGSLRHKTGSRVNVEGYSFLLGLAHGWDLGHGRLTLGGFLEYGMGDFDTNNSFASAPSVFGEGNTEYLGGGLLARLDLAEGSHGHGYLEASGRFGRVESDFSSRDFVNFRNTAVSYDTSSHYYSAHLGVGYVFRFSEDESLDLYAKYVMTHQQGDSVVLSSGDPVNFDSVNSKRVKAGARFSFAVNEHVSPFFGLAFEHEFDGKAGASSHGFRLDVPKLKGSTGIGELGLSVRTGSAVSFDLGVQGHLGNRRGVSGSLLLNVTF
jgi:hypothetical protein